MRLTTVLAAIPPPARRELATMPRCRLNGFTLIEILVVIVVIAVLAGLVAPNVFKHLVVLFKHLVV